MHVLIYHMIHIPSHLKANAQQQLTRISFVWQSHCAIMHVFDALTGVFFWGFFRAFAIICSIPRRWLSIREKAVNAVLPTITSLPDWDLQISRCRWSSDLQNNGHGPLHRKNKKRPKWILCDWCYPVASTYQTFFRRQVCDNMESV